MAKGGIAHLKDSDKLTSKSKETQVNTLKREKPMASFYLFGLSDDDRKQYNTVSNKSEAHFVK